LTFLMLFILIGYTICNTIINLCWNTLQTELFEKLEDRNAIWKPLFCIIGLLTGLILPPLMTESFKVNRTSFLFVFLVPMLLLGIVAIFLTRPSNHSNNNTKAAMSSPNKITVNASILDIFIQPLSSSPYRIYCVTTFFTTLSNAILSSILQIYMKYIAEISTEIVVPFIGLTLKAPHQIAIIFLVFYVSGIAALAFWNRMMSSFGLVWTFKVESLLFGTLILVTVTFPSGFWLAVSGTFLLGLAMSGFIALPDLLLAAIVDDDALENKLSQPRTGVFLGFRGIIIQCANGLQGIVTGYVLAAGNYAADAEKQGELAKYYIRLLYAASGVLIILSGLVFFFFPTLKTKENSLNVKEKKE